MGGHSGKNAYMERANANLLLVRVLSDLQRKGVPFRTVSFIGGEFTACAIAREAACRLAFSPEYRKTVEETAAEWAEVYKNELAVQDPYAELDYADTDDAEAETLDDASTEKFINLMMILPDGLNSLHKYFDHKYDSAVNVGVVEMPEDADHFRIIVCIRFESASKLVLARDKVCRVCDRLEELIAASERKQ